MLSSTISGEKKLVCPDLMMDLYQLNFKVFLVKVYNVTLCEEPDAKNILDMIFP